MSLKIDLENIVKGPDDARNFTADLLRLILKADSANRQKLRQGFPNAVAVVDLWRNSSEIRDLPED